MGRKIFQQFVHRSFIIKLLVNVEFKLCIFNNLMYKYSQKTNKPYDTKIKLENIFLENNWILEKILSIFRFNFNR